MIGDDVIGTDMRLVIRLSAIEFPDPTEAIVAFDLRSHGHRAGPAERTLTTIRQAVRPVVCNGVVNRDAIVAVAANKLQSDFQAIIESLQQI